MYIVKFYVLTCDNHVMNVAVVVVVILSIVSPRNNITKRLLAHLGHNGKIIPRKLCIYDKYYRRDKVVSR